MSNTAYDLFTHEAWQHGASTESDMAAQVESYTGVPPASAPMPPLSEFTPATADTTELHAGHFLGLLWAMAQQVQGYQPFREYAVANIAAGAAILSRPPVRPGWEWRVNRVTVSVTGASAAATAALYIGPEIGETAAPDESYLVDFASALLGNSPSRTAFTPSQPYWVNESDAIFVVIAAAVGTGQAFMRLEGTRRQKP